jgi:outer membrane protein insertion porin family
LLLIALLAGPVAVFAQSDVISQIVIHGSRRIPQETIRARIFTHPGDIYDQAAIERDFNSLWNTGYFEDLRFEREETPKGWIIHVYVKEKPTIREIHYVGLSSVSQSDVLDRFKERKVGLTQESPYDPTKVKKAEVVIKELLSEHGRQFATIKAEVRPIPPASVAVTFNIKEGPKVKVGNIRFEGNRHLGKRYLVAAMKNMHPLGIPHSIFLENLFSKTYDATKLTEDTERLRMAYQHKGYFKVVVQDPKTQIRDARPSLFRLPFHHKPPGKRIDITVPVTEGDRYRLGSITFSGNKAITNNQALRSAFAMKDGDIFDTEKVRKGLEGLRKIYGEFGYINFTPVPDTQIDEAKKLVNLKIDLDEGKPFYVRRIEFSGNTTTRDKVIRRELQVEEGQLYNNRLWENSLLRLNQLGYFEQLKPEQATDRKLNEQDGTVDLTLKVKEKGKNSISLSGGISGVVGAFVGVNYTTSNLFGRGETFSVGANYGNIQQSITLGFTEPYAFDRPLQLGFNAYFSKYNFNQEKQYEIFYQQNLNLTQAQLNSLLNYTQSSTGFTVSASYPLHHSFKRIGLAYGFDDSSLQAFSTATQQYFEFLNFRSISGPNALSGIITSKLTPSISSNMVGPNMLRPHFGDSWTVGTDVAGLGGDVRMIRPFTEFKHFIPMQGFKPLAKAHQGDGKQTLGFRLMGSFLTGYGGLVPPAFQRFYLGGDNDIRGFDVRSITPYAFITNYVAWPLSNPDGVPVYPANNPRLGQTTFNIPVQQLVFTGGDLSLIGNMEYRVPLAGPVTLAIFDDVGVVPALRTSQLALSTSLINQLTPGNPNTLTFGCPMLLSGNCSGATQGVTGPINPTLSPIQGNWMPRMSTGLELQIIMPVINAPFRIYYAYNPLRLDEFVKTPTTNQIQRSDFPPGAIGDYNYQEALAIYSPAYLLREPRKTFRFSVATTF